MPKREMPRTQRALASYGPDADVWDFPLDDVYGPQSISVLVIPEAAVSGCKHANEIIADGYCPDCGAHKRWSDSRWQRPKILRVGRASK